MTTDKAPIELEEGELWIDLDPATPQPGRQAVKDLKHAIKSELREGGHAVENQLSVVADEGFRGIQVSAELAEPVRGVMDKIREQYPNATLKEAQQPEAAKTKGLVLKGGGALAGAALGSVLYKKGKSQSREGDEEQKKGRIAKAVGAALAVVVPAALIGKEIYDRSHGKGRS